MSLEVSRDDIDRAAARIEGLTRLTPVMSVGTGPGRCDLSLKLDLLQPTGSFKVRGAASLLTAHPEAERVVAASGGNFGLAVAHMAARLDVKADIFVPATSPRVKIDRIAATGATVHVIEGFYGEALRASRQLADEPGVLEAHAYDDPAVVAGQGTCGREILDQLPDVDTVIVAVGGAGLIGGIASWMREDVRVVAAETTGTSALNAALTAGQPVEVKVSGIAADSLGAAQVGEIGFGAASRWVDQSVLVEDDDVVAAQRWLWDESRLVAEPGAATAMAAVLSNAYRPLPRERVCVLVCGANTDPAGLS